MLSNSSHFNPQWGLQCDLQGLRERERERERGWTGVLKEVLLFNKVSNNFGERGRGGERDSLQADGAFSVPVFGDSNCGFSFLLCFGSGLDRFP